MAERENKHEQLPYSYYTREYHLFLLGQQFSKAPIKDAAGYEAEVFALPHLAPGSVGLSLHNLTLVPASLCEESPQLL